MEHIKEQIQNLKNAFRVCRVWKDYDMTNEDYSRGWNACIEKQKEQEANFIKFLEDSVK